jgi:hypothetical protein
MQAMQCMKPFSVCVFQNGSLERISPATTSEATNVTNFVQQQQQQQPQRPMMMTDLEAVASGGTSGGLTNAVNSGGVLLVNGTGYRDSSPDLIPNINGIMSRPMAHLMNNGSSPLTMPRHQQQPRTPSMHAYTNQAVTLSPAHFAVNRQIVR